MALTVVKNCRKEKKQYNAREIEKPFRLAFCYIKATTTKTKKDRRKHTTSH
jgi:hypothetical protein